MKILVLSDTHHDLEKAKRILETGTFDALWHLGDNKSDADNLADIFGIETISVMGNCDGVCGNSDYFKIVDLPFGKFYLTHGHVLVAVYPYVFVEWIIPECRPYSVGIIDGGIAPDGDLGH